jgi:heterodisulfide reductase subunit C
MPERTEKVSIGELEQRFLDDIYRLPGGDKIKQCIQCGTCGGGCPTSDLMDYSPREVIAALRAGMLDRVVKSNTVWVCTSCYMCTVRCPATIKITEMMYEIKRLGIQYGMYPKDAKAAVLSRTFFEEVGKHGRSWEPWLMTKFYLRSGSYFDAVKNSPLAMKMFAKGRLAMKPTTIKGVDQIRKIMDAIDRME